MKKLKIFSLIVLLLVMFQQTARAGFPIGKGRWLLVPTYIHYSATGYWDDNRQLQSYTYSGKFTSNYFGLYGGYGINRDLEFVFNVPYVIQTYSSTTIYQQNSNLGDVMLGLCYYLNHFDYYRHLSITGSLIIPFYSNDTTTSTAYAKVPIGFGVFGIEAKLGYAGTIQGNFLHNCYYDLDAGIRQYFATQGPTQLFFDATFGVPLDQDWKASATLRGVTSSSSSTLSTTNNSVNTNFDYIRGEIAIGRKVNRNVSFWGSLFTDLRGKDIGKGSGFSIFAVIKY